MTQETRLVPVGEQGQYPNSLSTQFAPLDYTPPEGERVNLFARVYELIRGRVIWAAVLAGLGLAGGGAAGYFSTVPQYRSYGQIQIRAVLTPVMFKDESKNLLPMFDAFVESQAAIMRSRRVVDMAMRSDTWKAVADPQQNPDAAVTEFYNRLSVIRQGGELVEVAYKDPDPVRTKAAADAVLKAYMDVYDTNTEDKQRRQLLDDRRMNQTSELRALKKQILDIATERGSAALEQAYEFKVQQLNKLEVDLRQAEVDVTLVEAALGLSPTTTTGPATMAATGPAEAPRIPARPTPEALATVDLQMRDLLRDRNNAERVIKQLEGRFGENHPVMVNAKAALRAANEAIESYMRDYQEPARKIAAPTATVNLPGMGVVTADQVRNRKASLQNLYDRLKAETLDLGRTNLTLKNLQAQADAAQKNLDETNRVIDQVDTEAKMNGRISVISAPFRPTEPFEDKRKQRALAGGLGGAFLGFGIIALIGLLDSRVTTISDAKNRLSRKRRVLGSLPTLPDDLTDPEQAGFAAYCVHRIRTLLQIGTAAGQSKALAVMSPSPRDGKTSLTLSLGLSFAAADSRTLLIDCDFVGGGLTARVNALVRRKVGQILCRERLITEAQLDEALRRIPHTDKRLGEILLELGYINESELARALALQKESVLGIFDVLNGEPLENCIGETGTPNLWILPLGKAGALHSNQLSPRAIAGLIAAAKAQYDVVLIDTGPLLGALEASLVASEVDEVVLTLSRGLKRPLVEKSFELLETIGAHLAGIVFNRALSEDMQASEFSGSLSLQSLRSRPATGTGGTRHAGGDQSRYGPVATAVASSTNAPEEGEGK